MREMIDGNYIVTPKITGNDNSKMAKVYFKKPTMKLFSNSVWRDAELHMEYHDARKLFGIDISTGKISPKIVISKYDAPQTLNIVKEKFIKDLTGRRKRNKYAISNCTK